jgi:hypothetical protein
MPDLVEQGYLLQSVIPECPTNKKLIIGWDKDISSQFWSRPYTLTDYEFLKLSHSEQEEIVEIENERCLNGVWFYNHGEPTYLTADNYHFLTYHRIDGRIIPDYIKFQTLDYYFQKLCEDDENSFGRIDLKPRREGDTQRKLATALNRAITNESFFVGIQSKTGKDASEINFGGLILAYNKLPCWRKPKTRLDNPSRELAFEEPPRRSAGKIKTLADVEYENYYLNSKVTWRATSSDAYDGDKLHIYIEDEYFKWVEADAYKAWLTHKKCLVDGEDIIGKAYLLSTVGIEEEEEKVSEEALLNGVKLWNESNPNELNSINQTSTGLYRWFIGAHKSRRSKKFGWPDKYGNIPEEQVKDYLYKKRLAEKDPAKKLIIIRQEPMNVQEALTTMLHTDGSFKHIQFRFQDRLEQLDTYVPTEIRPAKYWTGNLAWENNERFTKVVRVDSDTPRFVIPYLPAFFGEGNTNRIKTMSNGGFTFFSDSPFVMGVDPFNYSKTVSGEGSRGAFHIKHKYQNRYCLHYLFRPASPELFFEDVLMAAWYYGARINPERSGSNIFNWFRDNGCYNMVMFRPDITKNSSFTKQDTEKGTTPSPENVELGCNLIESYFALPKEEENENTTDYLEMFWHEETLKQLMGFDKAKREKYDLVMAMIYTEIACQSVKKPRQQQSEITKGKLTFVDYLMPVYDRSGGKINVSTHYEMNQREARQANANKIINPPTD